MLYEKAPPFHTTSVRIAGTEKKDGPFSENTKKGRAGSPASRSGERTGRKAEGEVPRRLRKDEEMMLRTVKSERRLAAAAAAADEVTEVDEVDERSRT